MYQRFSGLAVVGVVISLAFAAHGQQSPLRIAMTMADIPITDGAPDQGTEGIRFMGYTLYDPLVGWDLTKTDKPAELVPVLATSWKQTPDDPTRWIFDFVDRLFSQPRHPYTRLLLETIPRLKAHGDREPVVGEVPNPLDPPPGCAFHPRCPHANARCRSERPSLLIADGTFVACHGVEERRLPSHPMAPAC